MTGHWLESHSELGLKHSYPDGPDVNESLILFRVGDYYGGEGRGD